MSKFDPDAEPVIVSLRGVVRPGIAFAKPKKDEVYRVYIGSDIKVRKLNSGVMQVATGDSDWVEV